MKVTAILKGKKDHLGRYPIAIRINNGDDRQYRTTKIKVLKSQFAGGKVKDHPYAKTYNDMIRTAILQEEATALRQEKAYPDSDYRTYLEKVLRMWKGEKKDKTLYQLRHYTEQFIDFIGDMPLSKVTLHHLNQFKTHLNQKYKGSNNVWKAFVKIRTVYLQALKEKVIKDDAFAQFKPPAYKEPRKKYLTEKQVDQLEAFIFSAACPKENKFCGVWFLIGCYTGLRFSDMQQFEKVDHIKEGKLTLHTIKTGELISVPVNEKLAYLFESIKYKSMTRPNNEFNKKMREICLAAGIPRVTAHTARHTFGVRCAGRDLSLKSTADLLGHRAVKSTEVYYTITSEKRNQDFNKLF